MTAGRAAVLTPLLAVVIAASGPAALRGQQLPRHVATAIRQTSTSPTAAAPAPGDRAAAAVGSVIGAAAGGLVGFYVAGAAGLSLSGGTDICGDDPCGFTGMLLGAVLGEAVGIGIGAHLGGGARGDVWAPIGGSLGVLIAGLMAGRALGESAIVVVPVAQVAAAVWMAIRTGGRENGRT